MLGRPRKTTEERLGAAITEARAVLETDDAERAARAWEELVASLAIDSPLFDEANTLSDQLRRFLELRQDAVIKAKRDRLQATRVMKIRACPVCDGKALKVSESFRWDFDQLTSNRRTHNLVRVVVCSSCGDVRTLAEEPEKLDEPNFSDYVVGDD
jgi:hypothetical protein